MGLSSNQARFLSLTARQVDLEQRIQQICQRRLRLSSELENVATTYNNSISNRQMYTKNLSGMQALSVSNLAAIGYKVIGLNTDKVVDRPAINPAGKIVIDSQQQFMDIVSKLNSGVDLNKSYVLNCDIDLSGSPTLSNSLITQTFSGTFDGNGHIINGLTINASSGNNIGMFSQNTGTIKNLDLQNVSINAVNSNYVGAIVGINNGGTISNVSSAGNINGFVSTGGIAGMNMASGLIEYASSSASVSSTKAGAGGLVGENNSATINNSSATGNVSCTSAAFGYNVGGFAGVNVVGGVIQNSYSTGNVIGISTAYQTTGGFIGSNYDVGSKILNCYSTGNVSNPIGSGGFAGQDYNSGVIQNSYATGNVSGTSSGGFIGSVGAGTTIDNTNFYRNNMSGDNTGAGTSNAVNENVLPARPQNLWSDTIWDKSSTLPTLPTLLNAGYTAFADSLDEGLRNGTYSLAREADEFSQETFNINGKEYEEIDWRSNPDIFDELYKGDDVQAENKYDKTISEINSQDKKLQLEQTSVEVEYKAISSERESVKKILDTNAQSSFKYFS